MVEVIRTGIQTAFQDRGRFGYRNQGVPLSGAMDQYSARLANQILGNAVETPLIEFVMQGPKFRFHEAKNIVITGGDWDVELDGKAIAMNQVVTVPSDGILNIKGVRRGRYGYLAIIGGWKQKKVLGSSSYYPEITALSQINKGDFLPFNETYSTMESQNASVVQEDDLFESKTIKVQKGPEFDRLQKHEQEILFGNTFSPSQDSNRMAFPLKHQTNIKAEEIITGPVQPGTVQLTPAGDIIVLMRDAQTTGGYSRILQLQPMGINQLAQKRIGEHFYFKIAANNCNCIK